MPNATEKQLEAKVREANDRVADVAAKHFDLKVPVTYFNEITDALADRTKALSALEEHRRPKPLTAVEAERIYMNGPFDSINQNLQAVLDEAARRWCAVIDRALAEAGFPDCHPSHPKQARNVVRRALGQE